MKGKCDEVVIYIYIYITMNFVGLSEANTCILLLQAHKDNPWQSCVAL